MKKEKVKVILIRELREKLFTKTFIVMTLLIPGILFLSIGIQALVLNSSDNSKKEIIVISETENITKEIEKDFADSKLSKDSTFIVRFKTLPNNKFNFELKKLRPLLIDESLSGVFFVPDSALKNKKIFYYSKTPNDLSVITRLKGIINNALVTLYFAGKGIDNSDINFARNTVSVSQMKVSENSITKKNKGSTIIAYIFVFFLYLSLLTSGQLVFRSVIEEKQNRIVEILLSSVNTKELMTGKILGASITSLAQMIIWLSPVIIAASTSLIALPSDIAIKIPFWQWLYFLLNYILGLIIFLELFAATGSLFNNEQDAQSAMWPIMLLIMIPFFIAISLINNPTSQLVEITSLFPFASIMVMPARMALVDVSTLEFIGSIIVNLLTLVFMIPIASKIYRTAILMTGKRPSWGEVIKWLKIAR